MPIAHLITETLGQLFSAPSDTCGDRQEGFRKVVVYLRIGWIRVRIREVGLLSATLAFLHLHIPSSVWLGFIEGQW